MRSKTQARYTARPNSPITDAQANIIGLETERMERDGIPVTAKSILERARDAKSRLHGLFDWDDESAAEKHRIAWARELLASVQIIEVRTGQPARALYSVVASTDGDEARRAYYPRRSVLESDEARAQLSRDRYRSIAAIVRDCESIGLCQEDAAWMKIRQAVESNTPKAMALVETK